MKHIIYVLITAAVLASCQKELPLDPAISLFSDKPVIYDETAVFRMAFAHFKDSTEQVFPVRFGGTAVLGEDYRVSGDRFVFGGENPIDSIVVTTLKLGTDKTVSLSIDIPEGYASGKYTISEYTLQDRLAYFSLTKGYRMMCDSLDITFNVLDREGQSKTLGADTEVYLSLNQEKSTAVEGVDFAFADSSDIRIKAGESSASIRIRSLNPHPQDGKDRIVLNLGYGEKYSCGEVSEIEVSLIDTLWRHLDGMWNIDTLVTDSLYMDKYWNSSCSGLEHLPRFNKQDRITIDMNEPSLAPSFKSEIKYFAPKTSGLRKGESITMDLGNGETAQLQTFWMDNTNRFFSSEESSQDKESLIGVRFFPDSTDSLDFYIIDYVSRSFMPELETSGKYAPEKPTAASPGLFLNLTFTK